MFPGSGRATAPPGMPSVAGGGPCMKPCATECPETTGSARTYGRVSLAIAPMRISDDDARGHPRRKEPFAPDEHVRSRARHGRGAEPVGHSGVPAERRRERPPAHVSVSLRSDPPADPGARVHASGDPTPAPRGPGPSTVVEGDPAPLVVADPDVVFLVGPRSLAHVGGELRPDLLGIGHPDLSVRRVVNPSAVRVEGRTEIGERARIRVRVLVAVHADGQFLRRRAVVFRDPLPGRGLGKGELGAVRARRRQEKRNAPVTARAAV